MSHRQAVTKARARAYARAERAKKTMILDELVELTGWHRDYARAALRDALSLTHRRSPRFKLRRPTCSAAEIGFVNPTNTHSPPWKRVAPDPRGSGCTPGKYGNGAGLKDRCMLLDGCHPAKTFLCDETAPSLQAGG